MTQHNLRTLAEFGAFLPDTGPIPTSTYGDLETTIRAAVRRSIKPGRRTAIALSGGVDSACVAAMAGGAVSEAWVLDAGGAVPAAKHAARELGLSLRIVAPEADGALGTPVSDVVAALGHPTHSAAPFAFLQLYRAMAADGVQHVLTGDGADELFAGHAYHRRPHPAFTDATQPRCFWAAYSKLRGVAAQVELDAITRAGVTARWSDWTESDFAMSAFEAAMARADAADRLRFVDVTLRMHAQCVDLQRALCSFVGLDYSAPLSDPDVVSAGLAISVPLSRTHGKEPLRAILVDALSGRWRDVPKEPIASQTGGRTAHELPTEWHNLLAPSVVEEHGLFDVDSIRTRTDALDPANPWLPRSLVVAATAHARVPTPNGEVADRARSRHDGGTFRNGDAP